MRRFYIYDFTYLGLQKIESKNQIEFIESRLLVRNGTQKDSLTQNFMMVRKNLLKLSSTLMIIKQILYVYLYIMNFKGHTKDSDGTLEFLLSEEPGVNLHSECLKG